MSDKMPCPECDLRRDESFSALALLSRMRTACGDNGTRMQDELEDYLRGLKRDAERYRWLRSLSSSCDAEACVNFNLGFDWQEAHGPELDAAIDAARAAREGGDGR
ncbi:hypothetical protein [Pseudoxanthomonas sp. X-1]|uniref:hypothetical protein n=1 Tax=Pseudoxanthomonas sp. X-1 TaxID=2571115 RepID=UPI00110C0D36|nr:hypothetical protein [Pseudoxanthomonas sp. X-1]TMN18503.1 hypothetical protein FF950_14580 [Pseudoxanthomonas sp. X-1]UAY75990.1 hypothetical protein LAJ50_07070 [Pseudoxanthomonas sp. X-1]